MTIQTAVPVPESVGYPSLQALRLAHRELVARFERSAKSSECIDEVLSFVDRARRTGGVLEEDRERSAGQNILDYWVATLYRLRVEAPETLLAPFEPLETPTLVGANSPYPGLVPFEEKDCHFFFGREAVVADICELLARNGCVVITGPSGCGKSSLLRAGLLPALKDGSQIEGSASWTCLTPLIPGGSPLEALAQLLAHELPDSVQDVDALVTELRTDSNRLANLLRPHDTVCLAVDQIESLLPDEGATIHRDALAFLANLVALAGTPDESSCRVLVVCADEALTSFSEATAHGTDGPFGNKSHFPVPDLGTRELRDAILEPARQIGLRFEGEPEEIVGQLVRTLVGIPAVVPVLQFVMLRLWESRDQHGLITREDVEMLLYDTQRHRLNAGWALTQAGEAAYARAGGDKSATGQAMQQLLLRLVVPAPGSGLLLKRISRNQLVGPGDDAGAVRTALELLENSHLLRRIEAVGSDDQHIELVHDALARLWPRLGKWIDDVRVNDVRRERLQQFVGLWRKDPKSEQRLLNDVQLQDVADLKDLTLLQTEFIRRSREHVEQVKRQERRRRRLGWAALVTIAGLCLIIAALAVQRGNLLEAQKNLLQAQENVRLSRLLVAESRNVAEDTPDLALLMALEATRVDSGRSAMVGLLSALERNARLSSVVLAPGHVSAVGVSQDGSIVAAANEDSVRLWDAPNFTPRHMALHATTQDQGQAAITLLRFSPGGTRLAAILNDSSVIVWDVQTGNLLSSMSHLFPVRSLTFGSTDDQLTIASGDGYITTHSVADGSVAAQVRLAVPGAAPGIPDGSTISPDGSMLVTPDCAPADDQTPLDRSCGAGIVRVWSTSTAQLLWERRLIGDGAVSAAFSPDGTRVISGSRDGSLVVWDNAQQPGTVLHHLSGHRSPITSLALSPDGALLASGDCAASGTTTATALAGSISRNCSSGQVRIWSVEDGAPIGPVQTQTGGVLNLAFLPNSTLLASTRASALLMWNIALFGTSTSTASANMAASPGGAVVVPLGDGRFAAGSCLVRAGVALENRCTQGGVRLLDANGNRLPDQPTDVQVGPIAGLAASADGTTLAAGSQDGAVLVWNVLRMSPPTWLQLANPESAASQKVSALAFSDKGSLAANGDAGNVLIWDLQHGNQLVTLKGSARQVVTALAFNPATGNPASGAQGGTVSLWSGTGADAVPSALGAVNGAVQALAFSPDGVVVAVAADDQTVILLDVATGLQIGTPLQSGPVRSLALDSGGLHITAPDGRVMTLWDVDVMSRDALAQRACQIAHRNLSPIEWDAINPPPPDSREPLCSVWPVQDQDAASVD